MYKGPGAYQRRREQQRDTCFDLYYSTDRDLCESACVCTKLYVHVPVSTYDGLWMDAWMNGWVDVCAVLSDGERNPRHRVRSAYI